MTNGGAPELEQRIEVQTEVPGAGGEEVIERPFPVPSERLRMEVVHHLGAGGAVDLTGLPPPRASADPEGDTAEVILLIRLAFSKPGEDDPEVRSGGEDLRHP